MKNASLIFDKHKMEIVLERSSRDGEGQFILSLNEDRSNYRYCNAIAVLTVDEAITLAQWIWAQLPKGGEGRMVGNIEDPV